MAKKLIAPLLLLMLPWIIKADTITIAADNWCPINCDPKSARPGFMIEIAQVILAKHGHTIVYKPMPWARTLISVRKGEVNGAIGAYIEDAPDFIFPENEQAMVNMAIYSNKENSWRYKGLSSLDSIRLGVIKDYSYLSEMDDYIKKHKGNPEKIAIAYGNYALESHILLLLSGRLDAFIETDMVLWNAAVRLGVDDKIKMAGKLTAPAKAYIAFSPALANSKAYAKILSEGMNEIRKTGELDKILAKYGLIDWRK